MKYILEYNDFNILNNEEQDIKDKAISDGTFMKAPNGKKTNLSEKQWLQVRTSNFINWFGDWINAPDNSSKVIDENGEPLVVYHGTDTNAIFNEFRGSMYFFSNKKNKAEEFGAYASMKKVRKGEPFEKYSKPTGYIGYKVYSAFLSLQNPLIIDVDGTLWEEIPAPMEMGARGVKTTDQIARWSKRNGYDGTIIKNTIDGNNNIHSNQYVAFSPYQIKSATDNIGDYNPTNKNITK